MKDKNISSDMVGYKLRFCQKLYLAIKSFLDFLFALIGIIILTPLFLIVAIAIKIDSKGPVFFLQKRIGKNGKLFNCIKFRSMAKDAKHNVSTADFGEVQCYVTRVGKFIRKCSIDELPQLFNVLFFKMSLIGYRPIIPHEKELDEYRIKYSVYDIKPGITGWAQVNGRDLLSDKPEYKAQLDNYYKIHFSLWFDIKILFLTFVKVLRGQDVHTGIIDTMPNETNVKVKGSLDESVVEKVKTLSKNDNQESV